MRAAEFLRGLVDMVSSMDRETPIVFNVTVNDSAPAAPVVVNVNNGVSSTPEKEEPVVDDDVGQFVPPLQAKIELLKKSSNVKSVFDTAADEDEPFEG